MNDSVNWPNSLDRWVEVKDFGNPLVPDRETKFWAEYYNKLRLFTYKAQQRLVSYTAQGDGTIHGLTQTYTIRPRPTLETLEYSVGGTLGVEPYSQIVPFEFIIVEDTVNFGPWNSYMSSAGLGSPSRFLVQGDSEMFDRLGAGQDVFSNLPMVAVTANGSTDNNIYLGTESTHNEFFVSSHVINAKTGPPQYDTRALIVRGFVANVITSWTPPVDYTGWKSYESDSDSHWYNASKITLDCVLTIPVRPGDIF